MKAKIFLSTIAFLGILILPSACSKDSVGNEEPFVNQEMADDLKSATLPVPFVLTGSITDVPVPVCTVAGTVTDVESAGLLFMREEEKMARDVYAYFYEKYKLPVFKNITKSENVHMLSILRLMTGFKITDNSNNDAGKFTNTDLADLYAKLIAMGNVSDIEALKVGVLIEQTDIADLKKELALVTNTSIKTVYTNLSKGSEAHLKAFIFNLKLKGVVLQS